MGATKLGREAPDSTALGRRRVTNPGGRQSLGQKGVGGGWAGGHFGDFDGHLLGGKGGVFVGCSWWVSFAVSLLFVAFVVFSVLLLQHGKAVFWMYFVR